MTSFADAIASGEERLNRAGVPQARRDARLLLAQLLGCDVATLIAWPERRLNPMTRAQFDAWIARRAAREPVSRILGQREFWSLPFEVSPATLDPRPDSEVLVEGLLARVADRRKPLRLLDLGTGSGCLLLSLLSELPQASGLGVDCSADALKTAQKNARRHALDARAAFALGNWCDGLQESFDLIICNPPYIPDHELPGLDPEVSLWEPRLALSGGADGLEPYRRILPQLDRLLASGGVAGFEHGPGQADAIAALATPLEGWRREAVKDLAGRDRALLFMRSGQNP